MCTLFVQHTTYLATTSTGSGTDPMTRSYPSAQLLQTQMSRSPGPDGDDDDVTLADDAEYVQLRERLHNHFLTICTNVGLNHHD